MNRYKHLGYEYFITDLSLEQLLQVIKKQHIQLYGLSFKNGKIIFKVKTHSYFKVSRVHRSIKYLKSSGVVGFIRDQLSNRKRVVGIIVALITLYVCSNTLFNVEVVGNNDDVKNKISEYLELNDIKRFYYVSDELIFKQMENDLKQLMFDKIEWINFEYASSHLIVRYVPRNFPLIVPDKFESIIAQKDGMIRFFDVSSGRKMVHVNEFVKAGDVLVSNEIIDSRGKVKRVEVDGSVYGNTMYIIDSELPSSNKVSDSVAFFRLLFDCRLQISKYLSIDEKIEQENILQFSTSEGTISMKIQYTLYEDLSKP